MKKDVIKIAKLIKYEKLLKSKNPFDIKYGNLLKQEVMALNKKIIKDSIYKKAKKFYNGYKYKNSIKKICCDFKKLEEKSWEYKF